MTIKRRLFLSNVLMILVPTCTTALVGIISVRMIWELLSATPEEVHHRHAHMHPRMLLHLFGDHQIFFGPGESMAAIGLLLLLTGVISILATNRFLTRFVFRHIQEPLDILTNSVSQIGQGHLDHRIDYSEPDEFASACTAFNDMAVRLRASVDKARQDEETRKLLLAGISHDLRSPLTSIRAYTEGLLDGVADGEALRRQYLTTIHRKTEEIDHLVSQVFTYSKLDLQSSGTDAVFRPDLSIIAFLDAQAADYETRGLVIRAQLTPVTVRGNEALFQRILYNLAENSLKYRTHDPGHLYLGLSVWNGRCLFTATDDGPGVPEEALPHLFDIFFRTDAARQDPAGGSGLGLAIVRRCTEQLGGHAWAENTQGGGLTIKIECPEVTK